MAARISVLHPKLFKIIFKPNSYLMSISRRGPVNPSIPNFDNINLAETTTNVVVDLKIQSEITVRISVCNLTPLKLSANQIHI